MKTTRENQLKLWDAWADFLGEYEFQWFLTLTFKEPTHPEAAHKRWLRFVNEIDRALYGRSKAFHQEHGVYWVCATERQKRDVIHFHALMGAVENLNHRLHRLTWMDRWGEIAGFAKIEPIHNDEAVARYVTKYVVKDGEIAISDSLSRHPVQHTARRLR